MISPSDNVGSHPRRGVAYTLVAALLFGVNGAVAADLLRSIPAGNVAQIRSVLAAFILAAIAYRRRAADSRGHLLVFAAFGLALAAETVSFFIAISRLGVGPGITIQFTGPILVLAWQRLVERRPVAPLAWAAAATALVGVGLVSGVGTAHELDGLGLIAAVVASVTFAAAILVSTHLGRSFPVLTITAFGFSFSALILSVAFPLVLPPRVPLVILELAWLVVLGTIAPFLLQVAAVKVTDPGVVGVIATMEPVVAASAAWLGLGQVLTPLQVGGGLLVVGAVALIERYTSRPPLGL